MDSETEKFNYYLDECYFSIRKGQGILIEYRKRIGKNGNGNSLEQNRNLCKRNYIHKRNDTIRQKLIDEMMPEILDRAVEVYRQAKDVKCESAYLASCIFRTLINYDAYIERLFNQTFYE